ncbi:MAG: hypothetical protein CVV27_13685, partial [Candidatus Melainabacteria bacterium HGW-Melainabacteria-1]
MSFSNHQIRSNPSLPQISTDKKLSAPKPSGRINTESTPSQTIARTNVESTSSKPLVSSPIPNPEQLQNLEKILDQTPETTLIQRSNAVPKPLAMTQRVSVFSEAPTQTPPSETTSLSKEDFSQQLIRPNFAKLCKELDRTIFTKQKVLNKAQERGKLIAQMTPPGSDLMRTLAGASDQQLREMVSSGIALTKPNKYGPDTKFEGLSRNKQKMVNAIVSGIKQGLPEDIQKLRTVENRGDIGQVQMRMDLNSQIRNAKLKPPSQETLDALDKYVDSKGIDTIRAKLQHDSESLRTELSYQDLPVPDPAETSLDVLGNDKLKALLPINDSLKTRSLEALSQVPEEDRNGLLWTLAMNPFNKTCEDVSMRLFGQPLSDLGDQQTEQVKQLSQTLVIASLEKIGPGSGNSLLGTDKDGPTEITHNGKTYERQQKLGEGGFGIAFLFKERGGSDEVVVKRFKHAQSSDEAWFGAMQDEIRTHRYAMGKEGTGHDNVLNLKGIITRPPDTSKGEHFGEVFTVTDVAKGGELRGVMKNMHKQLQDGRISKTVSDLLNRQVFAQTIEGMHYIQKDRQMLHLDLKPENLFMTEDGTVKIGDFGLANIGHETKVSTGTMVYLSPEAVKSGKDAKVNL